VPQPDPQKQRQFALDVVARLRRSGFVAYWAGGCVRDQLLRRTPKDYDVATAATPEQIRQVFGKFRTLSIGAAFGVITVLGPREAGQIEVATFRRDAAYSDGRHPDAVTFSSAQEDATRRDFTINGLFYDPLAEQVIDFVDGQTDLAAGILRAIGQPQERFAEDKLRMLRAVRFAAAFGFRLEDRTRQAIGEMAAQIVVVSPERIAMEMRRLLVEPGRADAVRMFIDTGLAAAVFPEIVPGPTQTNDLSHALAVLHGLPRPTFPAALAALLGLLGLTVSDADRIARRWRLSNQEREAIDWLVEHRAVLAAAPHKPWSQLQRIFVHPNIGELVDLHEAELQTTAADTAEVAWCRQVLQRPAAELDPSPLITGDDLLRHGVPTGPLYRTVLEAIRDAQLDGLIHTPADALAMADRLRMEMGPS
jgi:tRNA nucleotidyltransferase/poly(A) polymerase